MTNKVIDNIIMIMAILLIVLSHYFAYSYDIVTGGLITILTILIYLIIRLLSKSGEE